MSSGRSTSASQERVEEVEGSVVGTGIQRKQGQLTEFVGSSVLIATAVKRTGEREVIGVDVGPAEDLEFWRAFLRQLVTRGLRGVRLVTSDSHLGLKQAVGGGLRSIGAGGGGHLPRHPGGAPPVSGQDQLASLVAGPQVLDWAGAALSVFIEMSGREESQGFRLLRFVQELNNRTKRGMREEPTDDHLRRLGHSVVNLDARPEEVAGSSVDPGQRVPGPRCRRRRYGGRNRTVGFVPWLSAGPRVSCMCRFRAPAGSHPPRFEFESGRGGSRADL